MALVLKDRVKEQTTTTGTGTVTLGGAVSGFETFSAVGNGNTTYYAIVSQTADEWEVGLGTYTASGTLLSRDTILESSNSDAAVNFSAGTKDVFVTYPADKSVYYDAAGTVNIDSLRLVAGVTVTSILDEDNMASNSAIALSTQQSIKAYVDAQVGTADTLSEVLALGNTTGGTDIAMTGGDKITNFESTGINDDATSTALTINSSENVGIGTTAPRAPLHVQPAGGASDDFNVLVSQFRPNIVLEDLSSSSTDFQFFVDTNGFQIRSGDASTDTKLASELVRITSAGLVGIGNAAPSYLLDLYKSAGTVARVRNTAATGGTPSTTHGEFVIESTDANMGMEFLGSTTADQRILFSDTAAVSGQIVYNHTSNYMALSANGSERLRITSAGNVGIGTTAPSQKLTIQGTDARIYLIGANTDINMTGTADGQLSLDGNGYGFGIALNSSGANLYTNSASRALILGTDETERMRITGTGLVGIGTSSPSGKLNVASGSSGASPWANADDVVIETNGATGISILAPDNNQANLIFGSPSDNIGSIIRWVHDDNELQVGTHKSNGFLTFKTAIGTERMRIDSSGNVGIGTSSPSGKLHVTTASSGVTPNTTGDELFVEGSGNSGITIGSGTSSNGRLYFGDSGSATAGRVGYDHTDNSLYFGTNGVNERMTISSAGNVGIGDTSPTAMLDVAGDAAFGGVAAINGAMVSIRQPMAYDPADGDGTSAINIITQTTIANGSKMGGITWARMTSNGGTSAASISAIGETTSATGLAFSTGTSNTEHMRITSAGRVGIGTTAPTVDLDIESTGPQIHLNDSDGVLGGSITSKVVFLASGSTHGNVGFGTGIGIMAVTNNQGHLYLQADVNNAQASSFITFTIDNSAKMRITSTGRVGIGTTAPATELDMTGGTLRTKYVQGGYGNVSGNLHIDAKTGTAGICYLNWFSGTGGASVGNGASGYGTIRAAAFTVSSDRRLKENISYFDSGLDKILQLKPATFDFINGENNQKGFIAQDVETVIPEVVGTTTMPNSDGIVDESDTYLTINSSAIIPYLVAAVQEQQGIIQEQQTIIESFETRLAALEA